MTTVNTIAALIAFNPATSAEVYVEGYYSSGDLGGGEFYHSTNSFTPNGGTAFSSPYGGFWIRVLNGTRVNARWFGAAGDGSTDDRAALQAAIDYCGITGYALYLSRGTYIVSSTSSSDFSLLVRTNGFYMEGDGYDSEIKGANFTPTKGLMGIQANSGNIQNVTIRNIHFNGNRVNQSGAYYMKCVMVVAVSADNTPLNITLDGLHCHDSYTESILDSGEGGGISVTGDDGYLVMSDYYPQNVLITNCYCYDNSGWGIGTNYSNSIIISNNVCWNNDSMGITLWNTQDSIVVGNKCYGNSDFGINSEISDRITISGNSSLAYGGGAAALRIFNTVDTVIVGNTLIYSGTWYLNCAIGLVSGYANYNGITYKQRPCSNIQISSNVAKSVGSDGYVISIANPSNDHGSYADNKAININDNIFHNTVTFKGVSIVATDLNFANNKVIGTMSLGASAGFTNINSNDISYTEATSAFNLITVGYYANLLIKSNILRGNYTYGNGAVSFTNSGSNAILFDNNWSDFASLYVLSGGASAPGLRDNLNW